MITPRQQKLRFAPTGLLLTCKVCAQIITDPRRTSYCDAICAHVAERQHLLELRATHSAKPKTRTPPPQLRGHTAG